MESGQTVSAGSGKKPSPLKIWGPPCFIAVLILIFSSTPGSYYPDHPDYLNNIVHFMEFTLLGFLLARAMKYGFSLAGMSLFISTTAVCATFGLLDEAHQFLVPQRVFDLMDMAFDSLGAAVGSGSFVLYNGFRTDHADSTDGIRNE